MITEDINNIKPSQIDLANWLGDWIWRAVQSLIETPNFHPSPSWAAKRLNVPVEKVVEAFDGLERLGIIKRQNNTFVKSHDWFQVGPQDLTLKQLLAAHSDLGPQLLAKLKPDDKYTAQFFTGDSKLLAEYSPKFMALYREMDQEGRRRGLREVIASQVSFVVLTNEEKDCVQ